jgi:hypothetical protein
LFEQRPEQRGRDEQHADHVKAFPLGCRPRGAEEQPAEEYDGDDEEHVAGAVGNLVRRDR